MLFVKICQRLYYTINGADYILFIDQIANQENIPITVYLYNTLRPESTIQEMAVEPLRNGTFANLTAKYLYSIGVVSVEDALSAIQEGRCIFQRKSVL